jgi:hypothetical protein
MRRLLVVGCVLYLGSAHASGWQARRPDVWISIAGSQMTTGEASVPVRNTDLYFEDGPLAAIGAPPAIKLEPPAVQLNAVDGLWFGIRAWWVGDKPRVVVYAMLDDKRAPGGKSQTPIAKVDLAPGQSMEIPQTEKWGASRVFVKATAR